MNKAPYRTLPLLIMAISGLLAQAGRCGESRGGPLPDEQKEIIQYMAGHHEELSRRVTMREDGYEATTTTENAELAGKLKRHFTYMEKRIGSGAMVRRWDPAFAELVRFREQIETKVEYLDNGIKVIVTGKTPEGIKVAQNHARIVTGFTQSGAEAVQRKHEAVVEDAKPSPEAGQAGGDNG